MTQTILQQRMQAHMQAIKTTSQEATKSKEAAIKYLEDSGIIEKDADKKEIKPKK